MKWRLLALCTLAAVTVAVAAALSRGGDAAPAAPAVGVWGGAVGGLSCSIRTDKSAYAPGEEIQLDVFLRNESFTPVTVMHPLVHLSYFGDALPLEISGPGGLCLYAGPLTTPPGPPRLTAYTELTSCGEIIGAASLPNSPIRIIPKNWSITAPGDYTVRMKFARKDNECYDDVQKKNVPVKAWEGELLSNAVAIRIVAEGQK